MFRHPHFRAGGVAKLDLIKRKTPAQRKPTAPSDNMHGLGGPHDMGVGGDDVREELDALRSAYQSVSSEMAGMQRTMRSQRQLIATLYARLGEPMPSGMCSYCCSSCGLNADEPIHRRPSES